MIKSIVAVVGVFGIVNGKHPEDLEETALLQTHNIMRMIRSSSAQNARSGASSATTSTNKAYVSWTKHVANVDGAGGFDLEGGTAGIADKGISNMKTPAVYQLKFFFGESCWATMVKGATKYCFTGPQSGQNAFADGLRDICEASFLCDDGGVFDLSPARSWGTNRNVCWRPLGKRCDNQALPSPNTLSGSSPHVLTLRCPVISLFFCCGLVPDRRNSNVRDSGRAWHSQIRRLRHEAEER
jgi:hypothetical protein